MKYTKEIFDFIKSTIEIGGAFVVDEESFVRDCEGEIVTLNIKDKAKPLMVYNENMKHGEHCIVNPLAESISNTMERSWYYNTLSRICGGLTHNLMSAIIGKVVAEKENKGDSDFQTLELFGDVTKAIDKKLLKECDKQLHANSILRIYYNASQHIAQAQTDLDEFSYMDDVNVRKRSFAAFQSILSTLLDVNLEELSGKYSYKSKHIGFGKIDAFLNLYVMVLDQLHPFVVALLPEQNHYDLSNIVGHMENLKSYNKDSRWFAGGTSVKKIEDEEPEEAAPWQQQAWQQPQQQQMVQQQQPSQMVSAPITATTPVRPFNQPTTVYPGYGQQQPYQQQSVQQQVPYGQPLVQQPYMQQYPAYPQQQMTQPQQPYMQQQVMPGTMVNMPPSAPIDTQPMMGSASVAYRKDNDKITYKQ